MSCVGHRDDVVHQVAYDVGQLLDAPRLTAMHRLCSVLLTASLALTGCSEQGGGPADYATTPAKPAVNVDWARFVDQFLEQYFIANPQFAVAAGRHEFDGRLPDLSEEGVKREIARLEEARKQTASFTDEHMSPAERYQREYVLAAIDTDLFGLREARLPFTNPAWYFDTALDPNTYVSVPYAPLEQRARALMRYAQQIPQATEHIRRNLQTPLPGTYIDYGVASFAGLAQFLREDALQAFNELNDQQLRKDLEAALKPASRALQGAADWLQTQRPKATENFALGPDRFRAMLQMTERITTPLEQLEAIGRQDLERNLQALTEACRRYAGAAPIPDCIARMNADKPKGGAVEGARQQLSSLRQFIVDQDIVSIPGAEEAKVEEAPPYRRQNFAYINIPGPYEEELPSVYYIAPPDPSWPKAEQEAYVPGQADLLFTSVHEVWPGHFLHFLHANRSSWRFGQLFVSYAFAEGWAHYSEELMVERGLAREAPERQVGQLLNALLRNVRYLCAIGLHTKGMSVGECEQMFREQAFQDPGNARQQAARGAYDPGYLNYTLGKLVIRKLRADWSAERGEAASWRQFHDELLSYGGPPLALARTQMLKDASGALF